MLQPDRPGASVTEAADLIQRVDHLMGAIEALKAERAGQAVRVARAQLGTPYHVKRSTLAQERGRERDLDRARAA